MFDVKDTIPDGSGPWFISLHVWAVMPFYNITSDTDSSNSDGYHNYLRSGTDKQFQLCPTSTNKVISFLKIF